MLKLAFDGVVQDRIKGDSVIPRNSLHILVLWVILQLVVSKIEAGAAIGKMQPLRDDVSELLSVLLERVQPCLLPGRVKSRDDRLWRSTDLSRDGRLTRLAGFRTIGSVNLIL